MTASLPDKPLIHTEVVEDEASQHSGGSNPAASDAESRASRHSDALIEVEVTDELSLVRPEPEESVETVEGILTTTSRGGFVRLLPWLLIAGIAGMIVTAVIEWVAGLVHRTPVIGIPAVIAAGAAALALASMVAREVFAFRRMKDAELVQRRWASADGQALRHLILAIGTELGDRQAAERAAGLINDSGPDAARNLISKEVLNAVDERAVSTITSVARQSAIVVAASPSPILDSFLLLGQAGRMVRGIATIYGYRPGALTLRAVAFSAARNAGAIALADLLAEEVAATVGQSMEDFGKLATAGGTHFAAAGDPFSAVFGLLTGQALSLAGKSINHAGGPIAGGMTAAWRLYRFGIMVLVALRPIPFSKEELSEIRRRTRSNIAKLRKRGEDHSGPQPV